MTGSIAEWDCGITTGLDSPALAGPHLEPARPNPFNPTTTLGFRIQKQSQVELAIFDLGGRRLATLIRGSHEAGLHEYRWDGTDDAGRAVPSGVYFALLKAEGIEDRQRLMLLK